ncbi:sulfite exporter TauE/SafE family protein [Gayadomonas joobiniege]|uniref:sulfite exporter TauE/SafE family protein n=1 Tax=Gayadomonas joobiniege TaxID=1234606 RepID=UPI000365FD8C|nr:sulfite exporter TauE/SafE family protein [Gayadomonas joobiniege]
MLEQLFLFLVSLLANTLSSLAGGGAGLLQLPAIIFLGLPFSVALATHKVASVALGVGASIKHLKQGQFEAPLILVLIIAAIPGVILGANVILKIPTQIALFLLGALTLLLGLYSICKPQLGLQETTKNRNLRGYITGSAGIFVIAFLNGSLTSGTGLFVTIWLIQWFGLAYGRAVSYTLVMVGILWNGTGAVTLGYIAHVQWDWLPALLLGSLLGGYIGAWLVIAKGNTLVKRAFESLTVIAGLSLWFKAFNWT